ncbi:hypothetical protein GCM10022403_064880 [Streptomyces coacervatus]|uniref:Luciferase-like domain-containing protein n=1 Tax=Streptomyces coacervatus TaxID=647381 RepID=A0ABP7IMU6_9ACTN|nr:LLM class flavin-dependent oxidoreductase [Streptomyces coacervatus]MDF2268712.1 LLM class flavin-dependent oxidoreductase [Streptomyces coacervatus]
MPAPPRVRAVSGTSAAGGDLGLTRSTAPEWRMFGVDPAGARAQTQRAFEEVPRLWTGGAEQPLIPGPLQRPHPPLWQAASSPASFEEAGRRGVGVLGTTLWEPLTRVARLVELYREAVAACEEPVGAFVNDQIAFFTFVHCAETDEEALRSGAAAAAAWHTARALTFFQGETVPEDELFEALMAQDSLIVGSPDTCRKKLRAYADAGIDRLMCFQQVGAIPHERVLESMRRVGELIPEFA